MKRLLLLCLICSSMQVQAIESRLLNDSHDINSLSSWGPYSKRYAGISNVVDMSSGVRFDFSVMPGYYRTRQSIPHVLFESGYAPWQIDAQMKHITYRYQMEWKDRVYVDVTYHILSDNRVLVENKCVNNTDLTQNLVLNTMAYVGYDENYPTVVARGEQGVKWVNAIDYTDAVSDNRSAQYNLVYDGWKRFEERNSNSVDGSLLAKNFGANRADRVFYDIELPSNALQGSICFRYRVEAGKKAVFNARGLLDTPLTFEGNGDFATLIVPYNASKSKVSLELISEGSAPIVLDGFYVGSTQQVAQLSPGRQELAFTPKMVKDENHVMLQYADIAQKYAICWDYPLTEVREVLNSELESFFRRKVHEHLARRLIEDSQWHYTNIFMRPVIVEPKSSQTVYMLLATGSDSQIAQSLSEYKTDKQTMVAQAQSIIEPEKKILPQGERYSFGRQLLQATTLSNIVYPVYTQREYIRHFTPGKNWNSLYTWDSGFISMGLIDIDTVKAFETIRAYTTAEGAQSAFIHHGTPLPIQFFAYIDLWNRTQDKEAMKYLYPRLRQFYKFMAGHDPASTTRIDGSGLLKSWDYFYNSGGWDDYPPQQSFRGDKQKYQSITPVVTTAYYIRAAKILRMAAKELGIKDDIALYDKDIAAMATALDRYSWDEQSGYFSYVIHDDKGKPTDILRHSSGVNFNMGLDGTSPIVSGICTQGQIDKMLSNIFDTARMWTPYGISNVDRSAPYYKIDGYWNGAVWMPHQYTTYKALLDLGRADLAYEVAERALELWQKECDETYNTFEHFIIASGRGAGWHQFSGLSSPVLNWFSSYFELGKVTTGYEIMLSDKSFNDNFTRFEAKLSFDDATKEHQRVMIAVLNPDYSYSATLNGKPLTVNERYRGLLEITLPVSNRSGRVVISER